MRSEWAPSFRSFDGPFTYTSASGAEGRCYLSVYEHRGTLPVVLVYELASNEGPSVTNAAASIATQVWRQLLPDAKEGIIVVEAYYVEAYYKDKGYPAPCRRAVRTLRRSDVRP